MDRYQVGTGNSLYDSGMRSQSLVVVGESQFNAPWHADRPRPGERGEDGYAVSNAVTAIKELARARWRKRDAR